MKIDTCLYCKKEFMKRHKNHKFCSTYCKSKHKYDNQELIELTCDNCGKPFYRKNYKRYNYTYCSLECEKEFKHKQHWEFRKCEMCGELFETKKISTQKMCSIQCQGKWQSKNLVGENSNTYKHEFTKEERTKICQWCGETFSVMPKDINNNQVKFCSKKCRQEWFAQEWSQTDEWKKESQKRAVYILEQGLISKTESDIQIIVNQILDKLNIKYQNEKGFKYCTVDNYLIEHNLIIEVMGTYWHADHRKYPLINYSHQVNRIRMDKIKHTYINKDYNIQILYLWENEIKNNPELCSNLIEEYINKKGILKNYHSFNYNNDITIKGNVEIPYMEWDIKDLNLIIDLSVKKKISHKQIDKWITFNCEYCGKEKEELISHHILHKHHYCSRECCSLDKKII